MPGHAQTPALNYTTSWLGNSYPASMTEAPPQKHVPMDVDSLFVRSDGAIFTNASADETHWEACAFNTSGDLLGHTEFSHGDTTGRAVAANSRFLYIPWKNGGVARFKSDGSQVNAEGKLPGDYFEGASGGPVFSVSADAQGVRGMTANESELYISDYAAGQVKVYEADQSLTNKFKRAFSVARPTHLALAPDGSVWVLQAAGDGQAAQVSHFSSTGTNLNHTITFASGVEPSCLAYDAKNGRVLVGDDGRDQNIKIYNPAALSGSPTALLGTFGESALNGGGGTIGTVGPKRFMGVTGVGVDASGNLYVSQNGQGPRGPRSDYNNDGLGTVVEKYNSAGTRQWARHGLTFCTVADADPGSESDVYTETEHYVLNYGSNSPGSEWGNGSGYKGITYNRFKYPNDWRLQVNNTDRGTPFVRRIGGKKFLFLTDMYASVLAVYRFNEATDGEVAIPYALFSKGRLQNENRFDWIPSQPASGEWLWIDRDGDGQIEATGGNGSEYFQPAGATNNPAGAGWGWWVDSRGDVWQSGGSTMRRFKLQSGGGNPVWGYGSGLETLSAPTGFNDLLRLQYFPDSDTMYLAGYTSQVTPTTDWWGLAGRAIYRYDNWSGERKLHSGYPIMLPNDTSVQPERAIKAMVVAGDYVFAAEARNPWVQVYNANTGQQVGTFTPGNINAGWVDVPYGIRAFRRQSGEYVVFSTLR